MSMELRHEHVCPNVSDTVNENCIDMLILHLLGNKIYVHFDSV